SDFLTGPPASKRRDIGFTMFRIDNTNELVPAACTGSLGSPCVPRTKESTDYDTFWFKPVSVLGLDSIDGTYSSSLELDLSFSLSLRPALTLPASEDHSLAS